MATLQFTALDVRRPAKEILVDKLNAANALTLLASDFVLSAPTPIVGDGFDTVITLAPTVSSAWYNSLTLYYNRLDLAELFTAARTVLTQGALTIHAALEAINAAYGIYLTVDDVEDDALVFSTAGVITTSAHITLVAKTTSPLFKGIVELTLNAPVSQGVGTYEDGQTYYALTQEGGIDTLRAFNSQGGELSAFNYLDGATVNASSIQSMVRLTTGNLLLIGNTTYTPTNVLGTPTPVTVTGVEISPRGAILGTTAGARFSTDANLTYIPDAAHGFVYALDPTNAIGGNDHRVHRFTVAGLYDNTFSLTGVTSPVLKMAVGATGDLFMVTASGEGFEIHKRHADGAVDPTYTAPLVEVTLSAVGQLVECNALTVTADAVLLRVQTAGENDSNHVLSISGTPSWTGANTFAQSHWAGVLKFDLSGAPLATFNTLHHDRGPSALGELADASSGAERSFVFQSGAYVVYAGLRTSPVYGVALPNVVTLDAATGRVQDTAAEFSAQTSVWQQLVGCTANQTGELMAWGEAYDMAPAGPSVAYGAIALYSRRGTPGGVFVRVPSASVKHVISVAG